tara:strand:- start:3414 stop:4094 length:681 start_codon:yes stop_codon:yes gene_type:complete
MKPGFDVCLHNKRLDLQVKPTPQKIVQKPESEQPAPRMGFHSAMASCSRIYKSRSNFSGTSWLAYVIFMLSLVHVGFFLWYTPSLRIGSFTRNFAIILTPCIIAMDVNILVRLHVLMAHTAGVYALIFHPTENEVICESFYVAAFFIVFTLALCKPRTNRSKVPNAPEQVESEINFKLRDFIDIMSILAIALLIILKFGSLTTEISLDVSMVTTVVLVYIASYIPL